MYNLPIALMLLGAINIWLPMYKGKSETPVNNTTKNKSLKNDIGLSANLYVSKDIAILAFKLFLVPLFSLFCNVMDVVTDYMAFIGYLHHGEYKWALGTLALIILSTVTTSAISLKGSDNQSPTFYHVSKISRNVTNICICTFSPILIQIELLLTNFNIWKLHVGQKSSESNKKREEKTSKLIRMHENIVLLLMKLAFCELLCENFGQGILQAHILSHELGKSDLCLPNDGTLNWAIKTEHWPTLSNNFASFSALNGVKMGSNCICDLWVAKGLEHCYPATFLAKNQPKFPLMNCYIAQCYMSKNTWKVIFPFIQVLFSLLQISVSMTHLGAVKNLQHVTSFLIPWKIGLFYLITPSYFFISIGTSLLLSTYLANFYQSPYLQLLAFLSVLRLVLPEATPFRKTFPPWLLRILSVMLPLAAHFPLYFMMYHQLQLDGGCTLPVQNEITYHMHQNQTYGHFVAAYFMTTPKVETALLVNLRNMSFFPIDINTLPISSRMPLSRNEAVFNVRNSFNVFGHFFLWTGALISVDMLLTIKFLCFWIFVVQPHQMVPKQDESTSLLPQKNLAKCKIRRNSY